MPRSTCTRLPIPLIVGTALVFGSAAVQVGYAQEAAVAGAPAAEPIEKLSAEELDELVGPIALYPDDLIAQILPASTYPLEVVQAARFLEERKGKVDEETINSLDHDTSVLALMHYPEVLKMMNEDLDWTTTLGDAVVTQQEDVMAAIQRIRAQAQAAGNLETNEYVTVVNEREIIRIVQANPAIIYVPRYDPAVVVVERRTADPAVIFTTGLAVGAWLGYGCDWHYGHVNIDVHRRHYWGRVRPGWGAHPVWRHNTARRAAHRHGARAGYRAGHRAGRRSGAVAGRRTDAAAGRRAGATAGRRSGAATGRRAATTPKATPYGGYRSNQAARQHSQRGAASRRGAHAQPARRSPTVSRNAYGGYKSRSSVQRHSSRGSRSRGISRGGGGRRGGGRRR
jgi:hypothetical protein